MIDHDRLFKELLSTFFIEFLELFLPQLASAIERDSIMFQPQEYFADLTTGETKVIDLLASVRLAGQAVGFLIHVEAQASAEADFTRRIFFYFARLIRSIGNAFIQWSFFRLMSPTVKSLTSTPSSLMI
jgi:hypothetical protein